MEYRIAIKKNKEDLYEIIWSDLQNIDLGLKKTEVQGV